MARRVVGLDIGTHGVRAAELQLGGDTPVLRRFGQVALAPGVVEAGEVVDPHALGAALRRLWSEARFGTRDVIVGVANQRVVVRQADVPAVPEDDLRSGLEFQVQELIPIPAAEAQLDFLIVDERVDSGDEEDLMRILLVAAQRDMVESLLAALEVAGLRPSMVDLGPFALLRAVGTATALPEEGGEAIVDVGAGVTTVVVHEDGVPQFVRVVPTGTAQITQTIADELEIGVDEAEDLKRRAAADSDDELLRRAAAITEREVGTYVEEIRGSLDFYVAQSALGSISRVLVTGGGVRTHGLVAGLADVVAAPVDVANPLLGLEIGRTGLGPDQLEAARDLMASAVGLALAGQPLGSGERRINLLPTAVAEARAGRRQLTAVGGGLAGLALLLLLLWVARGAQVGNERDKASEAEARSSELQAEIAQLSDVAALETELQDRQDTVEAVLATDVAWTRLLQEVATVLPNDVWLTSFSGSGTGSLSFAGQGLDDHTTSARWLLRVSELQSLAGLWLPSSVKVDDEQGALITFSSTAVLTPNALSDRVEQFTGGPVP